MPKISRSFRKCNACFGVFEEVNYPFGYQSIIKDNELYGEGNSINYTYRIQDTRLGRFLSIDPKYRDYPYYSPYAFSGNRVIDAIELEGLQPGILFSNMEDAAKNFATFYNDNSIRANKEYRSTIYQVKNADGIIQYSYTIASIGEAKESDYSKPVPSGTTPVGDIHTHSKYSRVTDNQFSGSHESPSENQSEIEDDMGVFNQNKLIGYVVTPNGSLQMYDPKTGEICEVDNENVIPSDENDPSRKATCSSNPSSTQYKIQKGDTLYSLAKRFDTSVSAIKKENGLNDNKIQTGGTLTITN